MKGMVDVCVGPMNIADVEREIQHYMQKAPKRLVVDIRLKKSGYHVAVWLDKKTFDAFC